MAKGAIKINKLLAKDKNKIMSPIEVKRQPCEVYSRVTGYLRPVKQWNDGKQAEFCHRKNFDVNSSEK